MDSLLGQLMLAPYVFVPVDWHACNGALIGIRDNPALFSLLGDRFGGSFRSNNFAVPDLANHKPLEHLRYIINTNGIFPARNATSNDAYYPFIGETIIFPYTFQPHGWVRCDGRTLNALADRDAEALFAVIQNTFGGTDEKNFALPNLKGPIDGLDYYMAFLGIFPSRQESANEDFIGEILLAPDVPLPAHWKRCDGQIVSIRGNPELFSLLGDRFGGDGQQTYALPDLRGKEPQKGLVYSIATKGKYPVPY